MFKVNFEHLIAGWVARFSRKQNLKFRLFLF